MPNIATEENPAEFSLNAILHAIGVSTDDIPSFEPAGDNDHAIQDDHGQDVPSASCAYSSPLFDESSPVSTPSQLNDIAPMLEYDNFTDVNRAPVVDESTFYSHLSDAHEETSMDFASATDNAFIQPCAQDDLIVFPLYTEEQSWPVWAASDDLHREWIISMQQYLS